MTPKKDYAKIISESLGDSAQGTPSGEATPGTPTVDGSISTAPIKSSKVNGNDSWEKDSLNGEAWGTPSILHINLTPEKEQTLGKRWVLDNSTINRSNVAWHLQRGWRFATQDDVSAINKLGLNYGSQADERIRVKDVVLMVIPKNRLAAREKFIESQIPKANDPLKNFENEVGSSRGVDFIGKTEAGNMGLFQADPSVKRDEHGRMYVDDRGRRAYA